MKPVFLHPWNLSPQEAIHLQQEMRSRVIIEPLTAQIRTVGGVDVGFHEGKARAAIAVVELPGLSLVDSACIDTEVAFPYVPGLLSFRELPAALAAIERLTVRPDVFMVDGQGLAHPRRFGLACHLGVLLDHPTIGCAKSVLVGKYGALAEPAGSSAEIFDKEEVVGAALRLRRGCKPVIISIGHRVDLASASALVQSCASGYRLPEPTRLAHRLASH